jgi:hypothetical protein
MASAWLKWWAVNTMTPYNYSARSDDVCRKVRHRRCFTGGCWRLSGSGDRRPGGKAQYPVR